MLGLSGTDNKKKNRQPQEHHSPTKTYNVDSLYYILDGIIPPCIRISLRALVIQVCTVTPTTNPKPPETEEELPSCGPTMHALLQPPQSAKLSLREEQQTEKQYPKQSCQVQPMKSKHVANMNGRMVDESQFRTDSARVWVTAKRTWVNGGYADAADIPWFKLRV